MIEPTEGPTVGPVGGSGQAQEHGPWRPGQIRVQIMSPAHRCPFGQKCTPSDEERWVPRLSLRLFTALRGLSDDLFQQSTLEADELSEEVDELVYRASLGMCTDCGGYDECGCGSSRIGECGCEC